MPVGATIRALRRRRGLSQEELAVRAQISTSGLRRWEAGLVEPQPRLLRQVAEALGVSVEQLTGEDQHALLKLGTGTADARLSLRRGADCPGVVALLNNETLRASLDVTEGEATLLRDGVCGPIGPETEDEAVQLLQAVRYMLARRGAQA